MDWMKPDTFEIGGFRIKLDCKDGGDTAKTNADEFVMAKTRSFLDRYCALATGEYRKILEVGVFEGGSFVFLDQLLRPERLSAIELWDRPRPHLEEYVARNAPRTRLHCPVSQGDIAAVEKIIDDDFGGSVDLVIDDASHYYDLTKTTFLAAYPKLRPGGLYIIEDWGWNYHAPYQGPDAPWQDKKGLVNLVFELLEELTLSNSISDLTITPDMVMIRKPLEPAHAPLFTRHGRRGRELGEL